MHLDSLVAWKPTPDPDDDEVTNNTESVICIVSSFFRPSFSPVVCLSLFCWNLMNDLFLFLKVDADSLILFVNEEGKEARYTIDKNTDRSLSM